MHENELISIVNERKPHPVIEKFSKKMQPQKGNKITKEDVAREIRSFLTEQGFELGAYSNRYHTIGIGYHCALVKPEYSPKHGGYTLAVTPTAVVGYACPQPYNSSVWHEVWKINYSTKKELVEILRNAITPPRGCWG